MPAFAAAAAALRRELTVPEVGQTVVLTRIAHRATPMPPGEDLASLGATGATLVLHLAVQRIEQVVAELTPHYGQDCPAAVVAYASQQREVDPARHPRLTSPPRYWPPGCGAPR